MDPMAQFGAAFFMETRKLLDDFGALLLANEHTHMFSHDDIDRMFRILHTIKGSAGMMGLSALSALTHALEGLFVVFRRDGCDARVEGLIDLLFEAMDAMRGALDDYERAGVERLSFGGLIRTLSAFQASISRNVALKIVLSRDCSMENVRAYLIVNTLKGYCGNIEYHPQGLETDENAARIVREDGLYVKVPASLLEKLLKLLNDDPYIESVAQIPGFPGEEAQTVIVSTDDPVEPPDAADPWDSAADSYVSVHIDKLEALQKLTGELILAQDTLLPAHGQSVSVIDAARLKRLGDSLRGAVIALRMTPISELFQRLHRTAREAARKMGREIEFVTTGTEVEIDKSLIDGLSEALTQLVRNAVVHGIESAEERLAARKPPMGKLSVTARNAGTGVVITVSDDGRGVSAQAVARASGIEPGADVLSRTSGDLLSLIMRPGVTTRQQADEMSGRGMGLDVVRTAVEKLRGSVTMDTGVGSGTTFRVRVPQTLAVMDCVSLGVGGETFLIPTLDVYRLVRLQAERITRWPDGRQTLSFQNHSLEMIDLGAVLGLPRARPEGDVGVAAILEGESSAVAVCADTLQGLRRATISPLPALIEKLGARKLALSGCTLLEKNRVGLILDAEGLLSRSKGADA